MADRVHSRAIRPSSPPSRNGCEEQSWGTATPGPAPIVFCIHNNKSHHGFMAAGSRILDEARILESLKLTHASLFLPSGGLLQQKRM